MMNALKILCLAGCIMMAGCCTEEAVEFAEFNVTDVSQPILLVDSISSRKCNHWLFGGHVKARIIVTGKLDGRAKVTYSYAPTIDINPSTLEKGMINDTIEGDHYYYKLWVKIMPIDCKKGHLKIRTKII